MTTITRLRPPARDDHGDIPTDALDELALDGFLVAPAAARDLTGRDGNVQRLDLYRSGASSVDIAATDRVEVDGLVYEVDGIPEAWPGGGVVVHVWRAVG